METKTRSTITNPIIRVEIIVILAFVAGAAFLAGVWFSSATDSPHNNDDFEVFWQSWDILEDDYYHQLPENKEMVYSAIQGLLMSTSDPYTFFVPPKPAELDRDFTAGEYGGIGALVAVNDAGQLVITSPFDGLPAAEAGLVPGDVILEVDGVSLEGWTLDDAVSLMRGEVGTQVTLLVYRPDESSRFDVEVTRARVELPTVESRIIEENVAYVRLFGFNYRATHEVERAATELLDEGAQALILDLRGNGGGLLDQAIGVSDLFLDEGVVVTQRSRDGDEIIYRSSDGTISDGVPLVVLMDAGSASASEVVAGALRDREQAVIVGQTSFGKGSVQHVYDMQDGSQLHVTAALWFTPNEIPIDGQGLMPDVVVESVELEDGEDPFIRAALDVINQEEE